MSAGIRTGICGLAFAAAACTGNPAMNVEPISVAPPDAAGLAAGNTRFAVALYGTLAAEPGNLFLSPWSISTALGMTYAGARGETATQMARALEFELPQDRLHRAFQAQIGALGDGRNELRGANALWAQNGYAFQGAYLAALREHYGAEAENLDFERSLEAARGRINDWVADRTEDRIRDLFPPGVLTPLTRLVLTNAIYFKGRWESPFRESRTHQAPFHLGGGGTKSVMLMSQKEDFGYFEGESFQVLEMPYEGGDLALVIVLPAKPGGLPALEAGLSAADLERWIGGLHEQEVQVLVPRFELSGEFGLRPALESLGMSDAFSGNADFSGIDGTRDLFLQAVRHKAWVRVDEEGTEAAAATGIAVGLAAAVEQIVFRADRPFLFLVRDRRSESILFMGRLTDPE